MTPYVGLDLDWMGLNLANLEKTHDCWWILWKPDSKWQNLHFKCECFHLNVDWFAWDIVSPPMDCLSTTCPVSVNNTCDKSLPCTLLHSPPILLYQETLRCSSQTNHCLSAGGWPCPPSQKRACVHTTLLSSCNIFFHPPIHRSSCLLTPFALFSWSHNGWNCNLSISPQPWSLCVYVLLWTV